MTTLDTLSLPVIPESVVTQDGTSYAFVTAPDGSRRLAVLGDTSGFTGDTAENGAVICALSPENARALRGRLSWLNAVPLGLRTSAGFGDRLGMATPGHVAAVRGTGVAPIFAQQSVRENTRTGRTPQSVMDDAMWALFGVGWREPWGADADHLKQVDDIAPFVAAGYSFYTIDPGDHVDDAAETDDIETLRAKVANIAWNPMRTTFMESQYRYCNVYEMDGLTLTFDENSHLKAVVKYGGAIAHALRMASAIHTQRGGEPFDLEVSVDETGTTTSLLEHFYIASELIRLNVPFVSLAPRFVGRFEKGVDYIGDLNELEQNIAGHAAIMRHFGNRYKLSLHTGSDKFGVYPIAMRHTGGLVHLKTAGTSYLEALRLVASSEPSLFRTMLDFARERYETDRKTYHVSGVLDNVPEAAALSDSQLPDLLNQFDARQVLHVTFGSILDTFGDDLRRVLRANVSGYHDFVKAHFDRHLEAFKQ